MENVNHHSNYKTTMCKYYMRNEPCQNRVCYFAHGMRELPRRVHSRSPSLKESPSFQRSHILSSESPLSSLKHIYFDCAKCERMLMQPCKRLRPSPPLFQRVANDRLDIDKRHISRYVERLQYTPRLDLLERCHVSTTRIQAIVRDIQIMIPITRV